MPNYKYETIGEKTPNESIFNADGLLKLCVCCFFLTIVIMYKIDPDDNFNPSYEYYYEEFPDNESQSEITTQQAITASLNLSVTSAPPPKTPPPVKNVTTQKYFVETTKCRMKYVDPFTAELKKIYKPEKYSNCSNDQALITSIFDANAQRYSLHLNTNIALKYSNASEEEEAVSCCYREILRTGSGGNADKSYKLLPCTRFHQDFIVPLHIDSMIVDCSLQSTKKVIQQDAFSFVQIRTVTNSTRSTASPMARRKPSVLMIGIDTLSRINFRRTMPKLFKYLTDNHWYELQGYNKMGDNTFPNLMAVFAGYNDTLGYAKCQPKTAGGLDKCKFLWNYYNEFGYKTAYAEDTATISTFNYLKKGFTKQPTDYYLRPMMLAIEKNMKVKKENGVAMCVGRKHYAEYIYDFAVEFANRYREEPSFGLFWTNSFSHQSYKGNSQMDGKMLEYMKTFESNGILQNSIVIFFSDHGCRFGPLLKLSEGFLEERLPMLFISLPKWFKNQHPEYAEALEVNRNRLTSPYDLYMTLAHILELYESQAKVPPAISCPKCQSMFHEVPENRTCSEAGIKEHWCTCIPYKSISHSNGVAKDATKLVISEMNKYLAGRNLSSLCGKLELKSVKDVQQKWDDDMAEASKDASTYRIKFVTSPKEASFQTTAVYNRTTKAVSVVVEDISRLDSYAKDSQCINDKEAKKFCMCKK